MDDQEIELPPKKHLYYTNALTLVIAAALILTSWNVCRKPWELLGVSWISWDNVVAYSTIAIILFYIFDVVHSWRTQDISDESISQIIPQNWTEYGHYISLAVAAGVCEEIIYRGFLVPYLDQHLSVFSYSYVLAIVIPAISFGVSHLYQGWVAVTKILVVAILFGVIFYYSQSLIIVVLLHVGIDLVSGAMGLVKTEKKID
jgi:uncharacterized protein